MATKKGVIKEFKFEGEIVFQSLDAYVGRFKDTTKELKSTEKLEISADHFPGDFDATTHTVIGKVVRTFQVVEK